MTAITATKFSLINRAPLVPPSALRPPDKGMSPLSLPGEMTRAMIRN